MADVPIPKNETERIETLLRYGIMDTPSDPVIDNAAQAAADICNTPFATVSIVDGTRCWHLANVGLSNPESPRSVAFSAHAILQPGHLMEIEDTIKDDRFNNNPLVTEGHGLRFYAGAPLATAEGFVLGALMVADRKPRRLTTAQKNALTRLADVVMTLLDKHKKVLHEGISKAMDKALQHGILITNANPSLDYRIEYCNPAFERLTGYPRAEIYGKNCRFLQGKDTDPEAVAVLRRAIVTQWHNKTITLKNYRKNGSEFWNEVNISPIKDSYGNTTHFVSIHRDATEQIEAQRKAVQFDADILEAVDNEIYIFDEKSLNFVYANRLAQENLGYSMQELSNLTPADIKPNASLETVESNIRPLQLNGEKELRYAAYLRRKDRSTYPVKVRLRQSKFQAEPVLVAVIQDMSKTDGAKTHFSSKSDIWNSQTANLL